MMATALDLANRSLKLIVVEAADSPLEPDEYQDYYDALNDFMADLEVRGVRLGFTTVSNPSDEITVPPGAIRGIVANMAIEVAPDYGATVSQPLVLQAQEGMRALRRLGQAPIRASYPPTLPMGTGNDDYPDDWTHYEADAGGVAWLAGNTTVTDVVTVSTPVRVRGAWVSDGFEALQLTSAGRTTNPRGERVTLTVKASFTATCASSVSANFILMRNGAEQVATTTVALSTTRVDGTISSTVILEPGEYVELWVENTTDATDITVADARLEVD
jgi:hypothetical protein